MDGLQDRGSMRPAFTWRGVDAASTWILRLGKPIGLLLLAIAILGDIYLRATVLPSRAPRDRWPTEGYYFAGAQYQLGLQALRLELWRHQQLPQGAERIRSEQDAKMLRDVLHAKYAILTESPELRPFLEQVPGFREALPFLTDIEARLNDLVGDALRTPDALPRFDDQIAALERAVVGMVNDLRVAELSTFEAAFEAQRRAAILSQETGLALLGVLGLGLILHVSIRRKELAAFRLEAEARAEAQRSAQARTALLGMVSHELRTPLQTMMGNVEMLTLTANDEASRPSISSLERNLALLSGQLDNIAQYTRLAGNTFEMRSESFALVPLIERVVDEHRAGSGGLKPDILVETALSPPSFGDSGPGSPATNPEQLYLQCGQVRWAGHHYRERKSRTLAGANRITDLRHRSQRRWARHSSVRVGRDLGTVRARSPDRCSPFGKRAGAGCRKVAGAVSRLAGRAFAPGACRKGLFRSLSGQASRRAQPFYRGLDENARTVVLGLRPGVNLKRSWPLSKWNCMCAPKSASRRASGAGCKS